jgi:hypothetical protein
MPCVACGSPDTAVCELLGHVYPIAPRENMHHARSQAPAPDPAIPARAPAVQLATVEHYRLTDPLFEFVEPELGE